MVLPGFGHQLVLNSSRRIHKTLYPHNLHLAFVGSETAAAVQNLAYVCVAESRRRSVCG
jgi:hypothetical protein